MTNSINIAKLTPQCAEANQAVKGGNLKGVDLPEMEVSDSIWSCSDSINKSVIGDPVALKENLHFLQESDRYSISRNLYSPLETASAKVGQFLTNVDFAGAVITTDTKPYNNSLITNGSLFKPGFLNSFKPQPFTIKDGVFETGRDLK